MASNGGKVQFGVQFKVDKSGLSQMKKGLQDVVNLANKTSSSNPLKKQFDQAAQSAKKLSNILDQSWNSKLGQLNLDKVDQGIRNTYGSVQRLRESLEGAGYTGNIAFAKVTSDILNTNNQLLRSSKLLDSMATSMANTIKWGITSKIFNSITGSIQQAYYYAKDLDRSLTDIRIVTGDSADQMQRFAQTANAAAKDLGRSTLDYTKAALTFYQQGLDQEQVQARTQATLKAENITGIGSEMADYLTAVWNGFNVGAQDAQLYVDKLAAVADSTASNMGQLATAISKVASSANVVGVNADQLNAQIATVIATTRQAPESVGTAFKTIYARINDIKAGTDDAQISLGNYSGKMQALGFSVLDASGHLRDTGQVIEQIGNRWESLTRQQQINLAQTMAGQRQYSNLMALFENWDRYISSVNTSLNAQGTLNQKNDRYMESLAAHLEQLGTQAERTYDVLFDTDGFKGLVDGANVLLTVFNDFIKGIGGGASALVMLGTVGANVFNKQLTQGLLRFKDNLKTLNINKVAEKLKNDFAANILSQRKASGSYVTADEETKIAAAQKEAEIYQKMYSVRQGLTKQSAEEFVNLQKQAGQLTVKIKNMEQYKYLAEQADMHEAMSVSQIERQVGQQNQLVKSLQDTKGILGEIVSSSAQNVNTQISQGDLYNRIYQKHLEWLNIIQETNPALYEIVQKLNSGTASEAELKQLAEALNIEIGNQNNLLSKQINVLQLKKAIEAGDLEKARQLLGLTEKRTAELQKQASTVKNTQNGMSYFMYTIQGITAATGAFSQAMKQGATGADKATAAVSAMQGTFSSIGGIIGTAFGGPMGGMIGSSIGGVASTLMSLIPGLKDSLENYFSTAEEKVSKLNQKISKIGQVESESNKKLSSLQAIKDEYAELSQQAGRYGQNLNKLTQEEQDRYHELTDQFVEYNDQVIIGYDAQGHAIVDNQTALKETIELIKQQKREQAEANFGDAAQNLANQNELLFEPVTKAQEKLKQLQEGQEGQNFVDVLSQYQSEIQNKLGQFSGEVGGYIFELDDSIVKPFINVLNLNGAQVDKNTNLTTLLSQLQNMIINTPQKLSDPKSLTAIENYLVAIQTAFSDQSLYESQNLSRVIEVIHQTAGQYEDIGTAIEEAQAALQITKNEMENAPFDDRFIANILKWGGEGFSDAYEQLESSELFDQSIYDKFIDYISGFKYREGLEEALITSDGKWASSYDQIIEAGQQYAEQLYQTLVTYGELITDSEEKATAEATKILNQSDQSVGAIQKAIIKYVENILNDQKIQQALQDQGFSDLFTKILENILGADIEIKDGQLKSVETAGTQIVDSIVNSVIPKQIPDVQHKSEEFGANIKSQILGGLDEGLQEENSQAEKAAKKANQILGNQIQVYLNSIDDLDKLNAIDEAVKTQKPHIQTLADFLEFASHIFDKVEEDKRAETFIKNYDKILKVAEKIGNGKELTASDKINLKQYLGLTDQQLTELEQNGNWLQTIINQLNNIYESGSVERTQMVAAAYSSVDELKSALNEGTIVWAQYRDSWATVFDRQLESLGLNEQALRDYAKAKHLAFETRTDKQNVLNIKKQQIAYQDLGKAVDSIKDKVGDYKNKADEAADSDIGEQLQTILDLLRTLGAGEQFDLQWIVNNFESLQAVLDGDIQKLKQLLALNGKVPQSSQPETSSLYKFRQKKTNLDNLSGARNAIESGSELNEDQKLALAQTIASNEQLNTLIERQGTIYSDSVLTVLDQILSRNQQILDSNRQQALEENQRQQDRIRRQLQRAQLDYKDEEKANLLNTLQEQLNEKIAEQIQLRSKAQEEDSRQLDADVNEDQYQNLTNYIRSTADANEDFADSLEQDVQGAEEISQALLRYKAALQAISQNYDDWIEKLNSVDLTEQAQAVEGLSNAYGDLLDMPSEIFSEDFIKDADNLKLLQDAVNGVDGAYDQLMANAQNQIITNVGLNADDYYNTYNELQGLGLDDLEAGAYIDNSQAIQAMNQLINSANMTATEAQAVLAGMGINAEVEEQQVPKSGYDQYVNAIPTVDYETVESPIVVPYLGALGSTTVKVPSISYSGNAETVNKEGQDTVTALRVTSARKSSGGQIKHRNVPAKSGGGSGKGKGGGGKGKGNKGKGNKGKSNTKKTALKEQKVQPDSDPYHKVNKQLETLDRNLKKVTDDRDKLTGQKYIKNLQDQLAVMKQQVKVERQKVNIARTERTEAANFLKQYGAKYDADGNITNYDNILQKAADTYNKKVDQYNKYTVVDDSKAWDKISKKMSAKQKAAYLKKHKNAQYNISQAYADNLKEGLESAKKTYDKVKQMIDQYEEAEDIVDDFDEKVKDLAERQIQIKIESFQLSIQAKLDKSTLQQSWNQFLKDINQDGALNDVLEDATLNSNNMALIKSRVDTNLSAVKRTKEQIEKIRDGIESTLYGEAYIDVNGQRKYVTDEASAYEYLQTKLKDLQDSYKDLKQAQDALKQDALKATNQMADSYSKINDEIKFQNNLLKHQEKLIKMTQGDEAYAALDANYRKTLANQKKSVQQYTDEVNYWKNQMNSVVDKNSELYKAYYENYKDAIQNLNDATEEQLDLLSDIYSNKIKQIIDDWQKQITNGFGLEKLSNKWDYIKERSEEVLDNVNKNYQINAFNELGEEYLQQAEGNLKAQKAIRQVIKEQTELLKQKQNVTQYDVDRANLLLQIEAKRAEIQDASANKTKLRLRRDAQGNYSYQYVAEDNGVQKAKKQLEELQNQLWNFTKNGVQEAQDNVLDAVQSFEEELADIWQKEYQSDEKRMQAIQLLYEKYSDKIMRYADDVQSRGGQLTDLGIDLLPLLTGSSSEYFEGLTPEEQAEYVDKLSGGILTGGGIQAMLKNFMSSGRFDAWFKELNAEFEKNQAEWSAEAAAAANKSETISTQAQTIAEQAEAVNRQAAQTAKDVLDNIVKLYKQVQSLTAEYESLKNTILEVGQASNSILSTWYNEKADSAANYTQTLVSDTAASTIDNNSKTVKALADYTAQWKSDYNDKVSKSNIASTVTNAQMNNSRNALEKAAKTINEKNPLLDILDNLGDYAKYIDNNMLSKIKDAFTFSSEEIRRLGTSEITKAYQQSVEIAATFPNVKSEEEVKKALQSMVTKASQYVSNSRYSIK